MKQLSVNNKKKQRIVATPTQQDFEQDRFYYNNDEDTREVLSDFARGPSASGADLSGYNLGSDEEQRVSKYW